MQGVRIVENSTWVETPVDTFLPPPPSDLEQISGQSILKIWYYGPQNADFAASVHDEGMF